MSSFQNQSQILLKKMLTLESLWRRAKFKPNDEKRLIVVFPYRLQAKVNALRQLQVKSGEELSALMPSILDKAFKGKL